MIKSIEKIMFDTEFRTLRSAYISAARRNAGRIADSMQWMIGRGFELLDIPDGQLLTDDGREVLRAHGRAWALVPEVHAQRLAEAMARARQRSEAMAAQQQPPAPPTTCTTLIDGQLCGGTLINAPVCPRCALGKSGVAATLTCDVCGHVTAIMREAK